MTQLAPTRAIIIAAGRGKRLMPFTDQMPKCLVPVGERSILEWQLAAYRRAGIREFVIVRGYLGHVLDERLDALGDGIRFVENPDFERNNILHSLFYAEAALDQPVLLSYSDIIFTPDVVDALVAASTTNDIALIIDKTFQAIYEGRTEHPLSEAEVSDLRADGAVHRVGKRSLPAEQAFGEFIGLMSLSARGCALFRERFAALRASHGPTDAPFQRADRFSNAYLTDLLQDLIDAGQPVAPVAIEGRWREIDTVQDLDRARKLVDSPNGEWR